MKQNTKINIIAVAIILTFTTLIYSNTFNNPFHYDDERVIFHNKQIKHLKNYTNIFKIFHNPGDRPILDATFALNYRLGKYEVFGYHLFNLLIHLSVCVLAYFVIRKMFFRIYIYGKNSVETKNYILLPLFSSLLFAVHPINSQTVNYISARSSSLCVLLMLVSLYLFIKFLDISIASERYERKIPNNISLQNNGTENYPCKIRHPIALSILSAICFFGSIAAFLLALGVRRMAVSLPLILFCYDYFFYSSKSIVKDNRKDDSNDNGKMRCLILKYGYRIISIIKKFRLYHIPFWTIIFIGFVKLSKTTGFNLYVPFHVNFITACKVYIYYIKLLIMPTSLSVDHDFPVATSFSDFSNIVSICFVMVLIAFSVYLYKNLRVISFSIVLFFVAPIVTSSILIISYSSMTTLIAEHRIYASTIGFCICLSVIIYYAAEYIAKTILQKASNGKLLLIQCSVVFPFLVFYSSTTYSRNSDWKDEATLWSKAVQCFPNSFKAQYNLGQQYTKKGDWDKSIMHYLKALELNYNDFQVHNNLGIAYKEKGKLDIAMKEFEQSVILKENYADARFNLAVTLGEIGDIDSAINEYNKSLALKPDNIIAMHNLGQIYLTKGYLDKAETMFKNALEIAEKNSFDTVEMFEKYYLSSLNEIIAKSKETVIIKSLNNLGAVYIRKGDIDRAIRMFNKSLGIRPNDADIHYNLGWANYKKGSVDIAEKEFKTALELNPNLAEAHNLLGIIYNQLKKYDEAFKEFKIAVKIKPGYANAHKNLGLLYLKNEDSAKAAFHLNETIRLNPNHKEGENIKLLLERLDD